MPPYISKLFYAAALVAFILAAIFAFYVPTTEIRDILGIVAVGLALFAVAPLVV